MNTLAIGDIHQPSGNVKFFLLLLLFTLTVCLMINHDNDLNSFRHVQSIVSVIGVHYSYYRKLYKAEQKKLCLYTGSSFPIRYINFKINFINL